MRKTLLRRQGFEDQRMLVLREPLRTEARSHPLLPGLCVADAGHFPNFDP